MYAGTVPVQLATSYLPHELAAGTAMAQDDPGPGGIYSRLAEAGHAPARFSESVRVRLPEPDEGAFLGLDAEQRVLALRRIASTGAGRVVEVNDIVLPAHQWELHYEWQAGERPGIQKRADPLRCRRDSGQPECLGRGNRP